MILDLRFLAGVAVGSVLGLMIAPDGLESAGFYLPTITGNILGISSSAPEPIKQADWPTNEHAKRELFRFAMWDFETFGPKSQILITRCISIDQLSLACEMRVKLSWISEERTVEGVFQSSAHSWNLIAAKAVNRNAPTGS